MCQTHLVRPTTLSGRWRTPGGTRRAGKLMIGVGVAGALIAVFGMVVGWIFVGQLANASDDSLEVTLQTLDAVDDTIDLADDVLVVDLRRGRCTRKHLDGGVGIVRHRHAGDR